MPLGVGYRIWFDGPFRLNFSLDRAVSQRRRNKRHDRREKIRKKKPTRTYCKHGTGLTFPISRTPRHLKWIAILLFISVNTKTILSHVLKISAISLLLCTREITDSFKTFDKLYFVGGGRVVRWCWVNFQCRGVLQFG